MCINTATNGNGSYSTQPGSTGLKSHSHQVIASPYGGSFTINNTTDLQSEDITNSVLDMISSMTWKQTTNESRNSRFMFKTIKNKKNKIVTVEFDTIGNFDKLPHDMAWAAEEEWTTAMYAESTNEITSDVTVSAESSSAGTDGIPYPSHNLVPALVYVGPSKHTDFK